MNPIMITSNELPHIYSNNIRAALQRNHQPTIDIVNSDYWKVYVENADPQSGKGNVYHQFEQLIQDSYKKIHDQLASYYKSDKEGLLADYQTYRIESNPLIPISFLQDNLPRLVDAHNCFKRIEKSLTNLLQRVKEAKADLNSPDRGEELELFKLKQEILKIAHNRLVIPQYQKNLIRFNAEKSMRKRMPNIFVPAQTFGIKTLEQNTYAYLKKEINASEYNNAYLKSVLKAVIIQKNAPIEKPIHIISDEEAKQMLSLETNKIYANLLTLIAESTELTHRFTPEDMHILETIKTQFIPEGLHNIKEAKIAKLDNLNEIDTRYAEVLTLSTQKIRHIIKGIQANINAESENYYRTSKNILNTN